MLSSIGGEAAAQIDLVERLRHYFNKDIPAELFDFLKPINYGCRFVRGALGSEVNRVRCYGRKLVTV